MKDFLKNIILLVIVLFLSYFTAEYFGSWYDYFVPQYDNSLLSLSREGIFTLVGIPFAYIFFLIIVFQLFGSNNKNKWILALLIPPTLLWLSIDPNHIYLPLILGFIAFGFSQLINILISKFKHLNPPIVLK